ncbi:hypothetical protein Aduo_017334 [Ancylostoma duodenale]
MMVPFIFCSSHQAPMVLSSAMDLLFVLICPIGYRTVRTLPYIIALCIPGGIYSTFLIVIGWIMVDDDLLEFCNPLVGIHPDVLSWWVMTNVAINICILIAYMIALSVLKFKAVYSEHRGVARRLSVIVAVFVFSWFTGIAAIGISINFHVSGFLPVLMTNLGSVQGTDQHIAVQTDFVGKNQPESIRFQKMINDPRRVLMLTLSSKLEILNEE